MANFEQLIVWQKSDELAYLIYKITEDFPKSEQFGITSQIRRAALSIPTNIVEGNNRKSKKQFYYFLDIALGSLAETEYLIMFSKKLGYSKKDYSQIDLLISEVGKLLWKFQKSL